MSTKKLSTLSFLMWALPLSFFTYQFILRLFPSLIMQQLMEKFSIDATAFGVLASAYYYGYSGMQIPLAIAIDRYGTRYVVFLCVLVCGLATFLFSFTDNWYLILMSRFLIGAASGVAFISTSKIVSEWFPKEYYSRMIGFTFTIGLMGAIYGGKPVSLLVSNFGWQQVLMALSAIALSLACLIYLFLRPPANSENSVAQEELKLGDFKKLLSSPVIWLLAVANFLMVGALEGFADVWGVPYLMTAYGYSKPDSAELTSFIFFGMLFSGPVLALLSRLIGNYKVISLCGFGMAIIFYCLIASKGSLSWYSLAIMFALIGVLCCYQVIVFAAGTDLVSHRLLGVGVAFLNCMNMLGGSFFHTIIGRIMDSYWQGAMHDGARVYHLESFDHGLMVIPVCSALGAIIAVGIGWMNGRKN